MSKVTQLLHFNLSLMFNETYQVVKSRQTNQIKMFFQKFSGTNLLVDWHFRCSLWQQDLFNFVVVSKMISICSAPVILTHFNRIRSEMWSVKKICWNVFNCFVLFLCQLSSEVFCFDSLNSLHNSKYVDKCTSKTIFLFKTSQIQNNV